MLVLLDNNIPRGVRRALEGHTVVEARERGWATLQNGNLLNAAELAGFEVLVTADKNIQYQQNLAHRRIALVVPSRSRWRAVREALPEIATALNSCSPGACIAVMIPGPPGAD